MVNQKFLDELDHAFRHAKAICYYVFGQEDIDSICIKEDDDSSEKLIVEYTYSRVNGYCCDDIGKEFPIKYLTMTLDEIRVEERRLKEEERLRELAIEAARKPKEIEDVTRGIKYLASSIESHKKKYYELTGEEWKDSNA